MEWLATSLVSAVRVAGAEVLLGLVACRCPAASQLPALGDRVHSQPAIEGVLYVFVTVNILQNAVFYFLSNPGGCWFASKASLCLVT